MKTSQGYQEGWKQKTDICPHGVINNPPGKWKESFFQALAKILCVLDQWPVWLEHHQAAVHVLQQVELALQDGVSSVGEVKGTGKCVVKLVLDDCRAGVDQPSIGDDSKLLNLKP